MIFLDYLYKLAVITNDKISAGDINVSEAGPDSILANILYLVYFIAGTVAVIVIISSGLMMVAQGSQPDQIAKRKHMIGDAVIGLIIVLLAFTITQFVLGRLF